MKTNLIKNSLFGIVGVGLGIALFYFFGPGDKNVITISGTIKESIGGAPTPVANGQITLKDASTGQAIVINPIPTSNPTPGDFTRQMDYPLNALLIAAATPNHTPGAFIYFNAKADFTQAQIRLEQTGPIASSIKLSKLSTHGSFSGITYSVSIVDNTTTSVVFSSSFVGNGAVQAVALGNSVPLVASHNYSINITNTVSNILGSWPISTAMLPSSTNLICHIKLEN